MKFFRITMKHGPNSVERCTFAVNAHDEREAERIALQQRPGWIVEKIELH